MKRFLVVLVAILVGTVCLPVSALSSEQEKSISSHCDLIKDNIKTIQRDDSRDRVYLGGYYETILLRFITPLNVRLVEASLSNADFVENQNDITELKKVFANDFVSYQKELEELVSIDCKNEPARFYEKLVKVRQKRKTMNQDVVRMRSLFSEHIKLVNELMEKM